MKTWCRLVFAIGFDRDREIGKNSKSNISDHGCRTATTLTDLVRIEVCYRSMTSLPSTSGLWQIGGLKFFIRPRFSPRRPYVAKKCPTQSDHGDDLEARALNWKLGLVPFEFFTNVRISPSNFQTFVLANLPSAADHRVRHSSSIRSTSAKCTARLAGANAIFHLQPRRPRNNIALIFYFSDPISAHGACTVPADQRRRPAGLEPLTSM